jgi:MoaA/NifB/PqqE/SkfB family radical SAM enzyme
MNYNRMYKPEILDTNICNRAKLDTGTNCNYKCSFCYYIEQLNDVTSLEVIKERIDYLKECEITEVDLSGGESSIHKQWFEILDYCTSLNLRVSCLSNGYKFADMDFLKKSQEHGLKEILFSLHGSNPEIHDKMVGRKGAYVKMIQAINNCHDIGIIVRFNCTVTKDNYLLLASEYVELVQELKPSQINFLTLNYWSDASTIEDFSYAQSAPEVKKAIDILEGTMEINVRYTPFCYMKGYEKYIVGVYQHIYDMKDWNIALYDHEIKPEDYVKNKPQAMFDKAHFDRNDAYVKVKDCLQCSLKYICDGVEHETVVYPFDGTVIKDVNEFRKN